MLVRTVIHRQIIVSIHIRVFIVAPITPSLMKYQKKKTNYVTDVLLSLTIEVVIFLTDSFRQDLDDIPDGVIWISFGYQFFDLYAIPFSSSLYATFFIFTRCFSF